MILVCKLAGELKSGSVVVEMPHKSPACPTLTKVFSLFTCQVSLLITLWLKCLKRARMCQLFLLEPFIISILSRLVGSYFLIAFVRGAAINHKIFETNSSFHVKLRTAEGYHFLYFGGFLLVLAEFSIGRGGGGGGTKCCRIIR